MKRSQMIEKDFCAGCVSWVGVRLCVCVVVGSPCGGHWGCACVGRFPACLWGRALVSLGTCPGVGVRVSAAAVETVSCAVERGSSFAVTGSCA